MTINDKKDNLYYNLKRPRSQSPLGTKTTQPESFRNEYNIFIQKILSKKR